LACQLLHDSQVVLEARDMATPPLDTLRELMRHMEWADASVWRAVLAHPPALQDERLRTLLLHLHGVQRVFLAMWTGKPLESVMSNPAPVDLLAEEPAVRAYYQELHPTVAAFDDATLERPIVTPGLKRYEEQMNRRFDAPTLAETVLQVASHSTYHRGQVNARLRELGGEPPLVDYIAWIWLGRPAADWTATVSPSGQVENAETAPAS
jgi:uncharacterized damage-inducible protein DinB